MTLRCPLLIFLFILPTLLNAVEYEINAPPPLEENDIHHPAQPSLHTKTISAPKPTPPPISKPQHKPLPPLSHNKHEIHSPKTPKAVKHTTTTTQNTNHTVHQNTSHSLPSPLKNKKKSHQDELAQKLHAIRMQPIESRGTTLIESARFSLKNSSFGFSKAEKFYHESLKYKLSNTQMKEVLLELATLYEEQDIPSKAVITLEKYIESFPHGIETSHVLLRLGRLYRDMSAYESAIKKFYRIFDLALSVEAKSLSDYRDISTKAQLEIADTYFMTGEYDKSVKLFARLEGLKLPKIEEERVLFKSAYAYYHVKKYQKAIQILNEFIQTNPNSALTPEAHYILIQTYNDMQRPDMAIDQVSQLLKTTPKPEIDNISLWTYWKRKASNKLANEFYEDEDFISALKVYQSMATLSNKPSWQWPVIYQIGRCYERLLMRDKAKESYEIIVSGEEWKDQKFLISEDLKAIKDTAKWRLEHIEWLKKSESSLSKILNPKLKNHS